MIDVATLPRESPEILGPVQYGASDSTAVLHVLRSFTTEFGVDSRLGPKLCGLAMDSVGLVSSLREILLLKGAEQ